MGAHITKQSQAKLAVTCPECEAKVPVWDEIILEEVTKDPQLRKKVASVLGAITGGKTKLDAEGRRQRALKAVQAREAKRKGTQS